MKTRSTIRWAALATLLISLTWWVGASVADPFGGRGGGRGRGDDGPHGDGLLGPAPERIEMLAEKLELSAEQQAQIETIIDESKPERAALRKQLMRLHHEMQGLMLEDAPDVAAVTQLATRIGDARTKMQILHLEQRLAIRGVLTAEQRDRFMTMHPRMGRGRGCERAGDDGPCDGPRRGHRR